MLRYHHEKQITALKGNGDRYERKNNKRKQKVQI